MINSVKAAREEKGKLIYDHFSLIKFKSAN